VLNYEVSFLGSSLVNNPASIRNIVTQVVFKVCHNECGYCDIAFKESVKKRLAAIRV